MTATETSFKFLHVQDTGPESGACCPHCGADGRYIYVWEEDGVKKGAMAGCYKLLTGKIKKTDIDKFIENMTVKQAKRKPLNGWEKTVERMLVYLQDGKYSYEWCWAKIREAVADKNRFIAKKLR